MTGSAGFLMLVPSLPGARVLEVSEDDGSAAGSLRAAGCLVTCVRGAEEHAVAARRAGFEVHVVREDRALAQLRGPFDAVVLSVALGRTRGPERIVRDLRSITRGAASLLAPGGRLCLVLPNPVYSLPVLLPLIERLLGDESGSSRRGPFAPRLSGAGRLCRTMSEAGLADVEAFAALPSARRIKFLVPLDGHAGAELFFRALVPRSLRASRRVAAHLAASAASHGLLGSWAPAFGVVASKATGR